MPGGQSRRIGQATNIAHRDVGDGLYCNIIAKFESLDDITQIDGLIKVVKIALLLHVIRKQLSWKSLLLTLLYQDRLYVLAGHVLHAVVVALQLVDLPLLQCSRNPRAGDAVEPLHAMTLATSYGWGLVVVRLLSSRKGSGRGNNQLTTTRKSTCPLRSLFHNSADKLRE